jgi:hypothetical protein
MLDSDVALLPGAMGGAVTHRSSPPFAPAEAGLDDAGHRSPTEGGRTARIQRKT